MDKIAWEDYYNSLDPMGKRFADAVIGVNKYSSDFLSFLFERGQLYGLIIDLMLDNNISEYYMSLEENLRISRHKMLVFTPRKEDDTVLGVDCKLIDYTPPEDIIEE